MNLEQELVKVSFLDEAVFGVAKDNAGEIIELRFNYYNALNLHKINTLTELAVRYGLDLGIKRTGAGLSIRYKKFKNDQV